MSPFEAGVIDGMEKRALSEEGMLAAGLGGATLVAGAVTARDLWKSRGLSQDHVNMQRILSDKERAIGVAAYVRKLDPKVTVVDTIAKLKRMADVEFKHIHPDYPHFFVQAVRPIIEMGNNAAALRGYKGEYVFCTPKLVQEVIDHEVGHIWDFRAKGITYDRRGPYSKTLMRTLWRPSYNRQTMAAEEAAWDLAPDSKYKETTRQTALNTYDKGFHANRAGLGILATGGLGILTAGALGAAMDAG